MHVPDGFLDAPTSIATGVVAAAAVGVALRGARRELDERTAPLAGLLVATLLLGGVVSFYASSDPDGLNRVAERTGTDADADTGDDPLAGADDHAEAR